MTERLRVTTDPGYFEEHAENMELWSPDNMLFEPPELTTQANAARPITALRASGSSEGRYTVTR